MKTVTRESTNVISIDSIKETDHVIMYRNNTYFYLKQRGYKSGYYYLLTLDNSFTVDNGITFTCSDQDLSWVEFKDELKRHFEENSSVSLYVFDSFIDAMAYVVGNS